MAVNLDEQSEAFRNLVHDLRDGGPATIPSAGIDVQETTEMLEEVLGCSVDADVTDTEVVFIAPSLDWEEGAGS